MNIKELKTKGGQALAIGKISVLVGANNSGKSQTLRDIKERMEIGKTSKSVVLDQIVFEIPGSFDDVIKDLSVRESPDNIHQFLIDGLKSNLLEKAQFQYDKNWRTLEFPKDGTFNFFLGNISKFKVAHLDSTTRLNLVLKCAGFNPSENSPTNILQNLLLDKEAELSLIEAFDAAFDMDIKLDWSTFTNLQLLVSEDMPDIPENPQKAFPITKDLSIIDKEGDGFKSFVGIILGLLLSKDRIILLDEPEAFLHPAQARFLGRWIADNSDKFNGQLIIATHSSNFLTGIISSSQPIDIYRLNRFGDETDFNLIPPAATKAMVTTSLLSSQRVIEGIFHRGVVVCEADADRAIYQGVTTNYFNNHEILFVHSHNKQTLGTVAELLMVSKIPVAVIADIDLLNDERDFEKVIALLSKGENPKWILRGREMLAKEVNLKTDAQILNEVRDKCLELADQLNKGQHSFDGAKGALNRISKEFTPWKTVKEAGVSAFSNSKQIIAKKIIDVCAGYGVFIVSVGELESWIPIAGIKQKNKWIIPALEAVYANKTPKPLADFVETIISFLDV